MFTDADSNEDTKPASLLDDVNGDSCRLEYIEIVPLTRSTDGRCTTDWNSGDWSAHVKVENLTSLKQESEEDDVISASCRTTNDAEHDEAGETQSHMQPIVSISEAVNLTRVKKEYNVSISSGSCCNDASLIAHGKRHTGDQLYSCNECGKRFSSRGGLYSHANIHTGKYRCTECGKCCGNNSRLDIHSRIHSGDKPYKCYVCDKAFSRSEDLNRHVRVHTGDKPHKCSLCDKSFSQLSHLRRHEHRTHSSKRPYQCPYCDKLFKTNIEQKQHLRIHTGAKPFSCRHCSECFTFSNQLTTHLLKAHDEGTWLICHICQKKFSRSGHLKTHLRRHEGAKAYVCSECPKCFCTAIELKLHLSKHS